MEIISKIDLENDLTNIKNNYYTSAEVAELKGVTRQSINNDIHAGKYTGAFQLKIGKRPWLIPKSSVDIATTTTDVVNLTRQVTPAELQQLFTIAVQTAVKAELEPLQKEIATLKIELQSLITETRAERKSRDNRGFFTKLFGR